MIARRFLPAVILLAAGAWSTACLARTPLGPGLILLWVGAMGCAIVCVAIGRPRPIPSPARRTAPARHLRLVR